MEYLKPNKVHVMSGGRVVISGSYDDLVERIESIGYDQLIKEETANG